jgi:GNAT superfamily N-acetyltransferase
LTHRQTRQTAALHHRYLGAGLFPLLGTTFLAAYHRTYIDSPHAVGLVVDDPRVIGFLVGTLDPGSHHRWTLRHRGPAIAVRAAVAMLVRPRTAWFFLRTRLPRYANAVARYARPEPARGDGPLPTAGPAVAVLSHVVVAATGRRRNTGRTLVEAFIAAATDAGVDEAQLVTASDGGGPAFYERLGWEPVDRDDGPTTMRTYRRQIDPAGRRSTPPPAP